MILKIYWTDKFQREERGFQASKGILDRIGVRFGVSKEVVKKIIGIKPQSKYRRFKYVDARMIKRSMKERLRRRRERGR